MLKYNLLNQKFGKLTVIEDLGSKEMYNRKAKYWKCVCECGNEIEAKTANLLNGHTTQCLQCAHAETGNKRRKDYTGRKFGKLTIKKMLYNYNNSNKTKCLCDCDCGKKDIIKDSYSIIKGTIQSCGCIKGVNQRQNLVGQIFNRLTILEEIFDITGKYNHKLRCLCFCGKEIILSRSDVMSGHTTSCGCLKKEKFSKIKYINQTGIVSDYGIEILDEYGKNKKGQMLWNCKCGNCGKIFQELPARVKNNHVRSCGCLIQSSRENYIENILKEKSVKYISQYIFEDCKSINNYPLRFDFAIFNKNNQLLCLIEYDGEQHYYPVDYFGGEEGYKNVVARDNIKNLYCKEHNIVLFRIPYTYSENEIKEKIYNILESVTTTGVA